MHYAPAPDYYGEPVKALDLLTQFRHKTPEENFRSFAQPDLLHIGMPQIDPEKLSDQRLGESSEVIQIQVKVAHQVQREHFAVGAKLSNRS